MRLWTGVCETLMPDVWQLKSIDQNDCTYVCELSRSSFDSLCNNLARQVVTKRTSKLGEWCLCRDGRLPETIQCYTNVQPITLTVQSGGKLGIYKYITACMGSTGN